MTKVLTFKNYTIEIPESLFDSSFEEEEFIQNHKRMYNLLQKRAIYTIGALPDNLEELLYQCISVREPQIIKLLDYIKLRLALDPSNEGKFIYLDGKWIEIPSSFRDKALVLPSQNEKSTEKLNEAGIVLYRHLPIHLNHLNKIEAIGPVKVKKLFNFFHLQFEIEYALSHLKNEPFENQLIMWLKEVGPRIQEVLSPNHLNCLKEKYHLFTSRPTEQISLESVGKQIHVTRERVRVLQQKAVQTIKSLCPWLFEAFSRHIHTMGYYSAEFLGNIDSFEKFVVLTVLEEDGIYKVDDLLLLETDYKINAKLKKYDARVRRIGGKNLLTDDDLYELIQTFHIPDLVKERTYQQFLKLKDGRYLYKYMTKTEISELLLRDYPNGVQVYTEGDKLLDSYHRLLELIEHPEEAVEINAEFNPATLTGIDNRYFGIKFNCTRTGSAFLWGRGIYIHKSFITEKIKSTDVLNIHHWVQNQLYQYQHISVNGVFHTFKDQLLALGVPNEYALYSVLRLYYADSYSLHRFPMISLSSSQKKTLETLIYSYIKRQNGKCTLKQIETEFIKNRGWTRPQIAEKLYYSDKLKRVSRGVFVIHS